MAGFLAALLIMAVASGVTANEGNSRRARDSAGSYSGVVNGQFYGGSYFAPDNGPAIFERFGDHPSPVYNPAPVNGQYLNNQGHSRQARASVGSYSGVSNGQFYGGNYQAPDNGPAVFNRFGDHPSGGGFAAGSNGGFPAYTSPFNFAPNAPPFPNPFEFNQFFQNYFKTLNDNLAFPKQFPPLSSSSAKSSFSFTEPAKPFDHRGFEYDRAFAKNFANQRAAYDAAQQAFQSTANNRFGAAPQSSSSYGGSKPGSYSGGAASSSASFGPGGGHQSANIYPQSHSSPNINTRFGSDSSNDPKPGGSFGVSSSSFSSSSDVNGNRVNHKQASTTVNNNGKVTTYTVRD